MSTTTDLLKKIDASPVEFQFRDVRNLGTRSGVGSALDRIVKRKILARTSNGNYRRLVPSALQAYLKAMNRQSASMKTATQTQRVGRPTERTGDNTNTRKVLEAAQALDELFGFQSLQDAVPGMPKSSVVYVLNKANGYKLIEKLGRGEYRKLVPDVIDGYYKKRGHPPPPKQGKGHQETVIVERPDGMFLIMVGNRNFLAEEVAFVRRDGKQVK